MTAIQTTQSRRIVPSRGRLARWAPGAGPLVLFAFLAVCVLSPYRSNRFRAAGDLFVVIGGVVEARNALAEGQFPIRVAPRQLDGIRYPLFQYYANAPFTVAGALFFAGVNPYSAWKLTVLASLTCGGLFTYLCALRLTRHAPASVVAGVVFVLAPYMFTDLNARGAFSEMVAFNLIPVAWYATLRCFASRRPRYVIACGLAWTLAGLSHNITYLYGVTFAGIFFVSLLRPWHRPGLARLGRLAAAGLLHAALMAWYVVPQLQTLGSLEMSGQTGSPMSTASLSRLELLLAPSLRATPSVGTPNLGLQVGWPVLAGMLLAAAGVLVRRRRSPVRRTIVARLLVLFGLAFVLAWSPVDVWQYLPKTFWFVQFPYRLLVFTTFFGAVLAGCGVALCFGRRFGTVGAFVAAALTGVVAASYLPRGGPVDRYFVRNVQVNPTAGGLNDYLLSGAAAAAVGYPHPDVDLARPEFALYRDGRLRDDEGTGMSVPDGAKGLHVRGEVPATATSDDQADVWLHVALGGEPIVVPVGAKSFEFSIRFPKCFCTTVPMLAVHARHADGRYADVKLTSVRYLGAPPATIRLVSADEVKPWVRQYGRVTKCRFESAEPVLLQMPVLFYPGLMRVTDHGETIPYRNVGRYVAVELPPGKHRLEVQFVGVTWANAVSLLGWSGLVVTAVAGAWRRTRAAHAVRPRPTRGAAPRVPVRQALAVCAGVLLGGAVVLGLPIAKGLSARPETVLTATASRESSPAHGAGQALDGRLDTAWAVTGPEPASLTLRAARPRPIGGLRLHARKTSLREAWHRVHVVAFRGDWVVLNENFHFPNAADEDVVDARFPPGLRVDRLELGFSDPVLERTGGDRVAPEQVSPGYAEIEILGDDG